MRGARTLVTAVAIGTVLACSSFGSSSGAGPDVGDASSSDGAAGDAGGGEPAPGSTSTVAHENAAAKFVATDASSIYWWSKDRSAIVKTPKQALGGGTPLFARAGQTVVALAVDSNAVYWIEQGPGDGGVTSRLMQGPDDGGMPPTVLYETTATLDQVALAGTHVAATESGAIDVAPKGGAGENHTLGITSAVLGGDDTSLYYVYTDTLVRVDGAVSGSASAVCSGLVDPLAVVADASNVYVADARASDLALFKVSKVSSNQNVSTATPLATFAKGTVYLALDNLGVVVANAADGTIAHVRTSDGAVTPVASGAGSVNSVAADADGVYWGTDDGTIVWKRR